MNSNLDTSKNNIYIPNKSEEIDFKIVFNFLYRNKKFIGAISIIFIFLGYLCSFFPKRIWEGQFQIVLNSDENSSKSISLPPFAKNFGSFNTANNLKTEVGILKSPSVLMPAYQIVAGYNDEASINNYDFSKWKNKKLSIELQKDTSILNIVYKDKNKKFILPVLEKMSSTYQEYSGKRKKLIDQNSENYLKKQIKLFKEKSAESLRKAQEYAIDQDLIYFDITQKETLSKEKGPNFDIATSTFLPNNINIENVRVSAANEIRKIDLQLEKIADLKEVEELQYIGSTIPALNNQNLPDTLQKIETDLVEARSKYTDEDKTIKRLLEKRKFAVNLLKKRAINYLKAQRLETEAKMEAALRPKGVLLKYKELIRNSSRDEITLIELENELRITELSKSRQEPPWELITKPTLSKEPVDDLRTNLILIFFFTGFSISTLYLFFKEKKSDKIFEYKDFEKLAGLDFGKIFKFKCNELNDENTTFLNEYIKQKFKEGINLIKLGDIEENNTKTINEYLNKNKIKNKTFDSIVDLNNNGNPNINFLIIELGLSTFSQIKTLKEYLELFDKKVAGTIVIEKD